MESAPSLEAIAKTARASRNRSLARSHQALRFAIRTVPAGGSVPPQGYTCRSPGRTNSFVEYSSRNSTFTTTGGRDAHPPPRTAGRRWTPAQPRNLRMPRSHASGGNRPDRSVRCRVPPSSHALRRRHRRLERPNEVREQGRPRLPQARLDRLSDPPEGEDDRGGRRLRLDQRCPRRRPAGRPLRPGEGRGGARRRHRRAPAEGVLRQHRHGEADPGREGAGARARSDPRLPDRDGRRGPVAALTGAGSAARSAELDLPHAGPDEGVEEAGGGPVRAPRLDPDEGRGAEPFRGPTAANRSLEDVPEGFPRGDLPVDEEGPVGGGLDPDRALELRLGQGTRRAGRGEE